jgi:hypothetical protein
MRPMRRYHIERDDSGLPCRMVWLGDFIRASVTYTTCPKCSSSRMVDNRCLNCWHDARNTYERRVN